jgi:hypothetical protein
MRLKNKVGSVLPETIERIEDTPFTSLVLEDSGGEMMEGKLDGDFPIECHGLEDPEMRTKLKVLLGIEDKSLLVAVTIASMSCFSAELT